MSSPPCERAYEAAGIEQPLHVVRDGDEAIAYLKGEGKFRDRRHYPFPRLLLLDLNMPRRDGFEVIQWVRESEHNSLRIIVLTTSGELRDVKKAYELGANSFITKSHDTQEFLGQLRDLKRHWL